MAECKNCGYDLSVGFCHACLSDFSPAAMSQDPRYCPECYEFLTNEVAMLSEKARKPYWMPKIAEKTMRGIPQGVTQIMSTLTDKNSEVDIISPPVQKVTHEKRGPKFTELPDDLIRQLACQGMGSKAIAARLRDDGIDVSYKTIQRRLEGVLV